MPKFYWFGDSWVVGDELELTVPKHTRNQYVFGALVSDHFQADFVNCGISGSSVDSIPAEFGLLADKITSEDTVFFCLTSHWRTCVLNSRGVPLQINPSANYSDRVHPYAEQWYKYFDTPAQQIYNYDRTIALLYAWCKSLDIQCWFLNLFTVPESSIIDLVPESAWLVGKHTCVSEFIMPINGNTEGVVVDNDRPYLSVDQWHQQQQLLDLYVRPGHCHPNVAGHKKIANELIALLETKA